MRRHAQLLLLTPILVMSCQRADTARAPAVPDASESAPQAVLKTVGPRLVSNATSTPLTVTGSGLSKTTTLVLGPPAKLRLPLVVLDDGHAFTRLPAGVDLGTASEAVVEVSLEGASGRTELRFINDTGFPDLVAMAQTRDGKWLVAASTTEDVVYAVELVTKKVSRIEVADGPSALAALGQSSIVVGHLFASEVRVIDFAVSPPSVTSAPSQAVTASLLTDGDTVYLAEHARDTVSALDSKNGFQERWRSTLAPNPRAMALTPAGLAVGSLQTGEIELLDPATGKVLGVTQPKPGTPIVGGTTKKYSSYVMNGKAPRALVASASTGRLFVSSIGPNIGPNPDKMEVSMNGGVGVLSLPLKSSKGGIFAWQRHLGFGAGVTEALVLDDVAGLLYASDVGLGLVRIIDTKKLAKSDADAAKALVQEVALPPPDRFPHILPDEEFSVKGRAGLSLHSGPKAIVLSTDRKTLFVLNRFTGTVASIDVSQAARGKAVWREQWSLVDVLAQRTRRLGQILYFADLGRSAMTCDACHLEGHGEGVLFEKTTPLRIYRSTTVRGSRETPPYFTPASTHSIGETSKIVGTRNRYANPGMSAEEIEALTLFTSLVPTLPNPFVDRSGAPAQTLTLPDGAVGSPRRGLALFEGKAACAGCHPSPQFTTDQDLATRDRFIDVGTPRVMPLRPEFQNGRFEGFGTPALVGSWDVFPMLTTGLAGLTVSADGSVVVNDRFPLRAAVEGYAPKHGRADLLSAEERNDLLAWVLSL
jgi:hypothetical protein